MTRTGYLILSINLYKHGISSEKGDQMGKYRLVYNGFQILKDLEVLREW